MAGMRITGWLAAVALACAVLLGVTPHAHASQAPVGPRVVGGSAMAAVDFRARWPFLVGLLVDGDGPVCGGAFVGRATVVTAAHCVVDLHGDNRPYAARRMRVLAMSHSVIASTPIQVQGVRVHASWTPMTGVADIAVLRLAMPVGVRPIRPVTAAELDLTGAGGRVEVSPAGPRIAGWGLTDPDDDTSTPLSAREASMPIASDSECADPELPGMGPSYVPSAMICAGIPGSTDSCLGDSGGPLVVADRDGAPRLAGIVSFGSSECGGNMYAAYTRVSTYAAWVEHHRSPLDAVPSTPRRTAVQRIDRTTLRLSWSAATDDRRVVGYQLLRRTGTGWRVIARPRGLSWLLSAARRGTYQLAVRALDAHGHHSRSALLPAFTVG